MLAHNKTRARRPRQRARSRAASRLPRRRRGASYLLPCFLVSRPLNPNRQLPEIESSLSHSKYAIGRHSNRQLFRGPRWPARGGLLPCISKAPGQIPATALPIQPQASNVQFLIPNRNKSELEMAGTYSKQRPHQFLIAAEKPLSAVMLSPSIEWLDFAPTAAHHVVARGAVLSAFRSKESRAQISA